MNKISANQPPIRVNARTKATGKTTIKNTRDKDFEKILKAQLYQLGRPGFVKMVCTIAQLPFLNTEQILTLSGAGADGLSLNRAQIYLRRAVEWGWLGFVKRYAGSEEMSELNPVATAGLISLFHTTARPLDVKAAEDYFESLSRRTDGARALKKTNYRARHFYLTPKGAKMLKQLLQSYRDDKEGSFDSKTSQKRQSEFVSLLVIEEQAVLGCVSRLAGLSLSRQLLLILVGNSLKANDTTNEPIEFGWLECGIASAKLSIDAQDNNGAARLLNYFDTVLYNSYQYWLILADTENLPPSWIRNYWKEACTQLCTLSPTSLAAVLDHCSNGFFRWGNSNGKAGEELLNNLARQQLNRRKLPDTQTNQAIFVSKLKVVIVTRSRSRAILWHEAILPPNNPLELEETLATGNFEFGVEVVTTNDLPAKATEFAKTFVKSKAASYPAASYEYLPKPSRVMAAMACYLKKATSNPTAAHDMSAHYLRLEDILPANLPSLLTALSPLSNIKFEERGLSELLEQPSKRRLLFTLHTYGPLDALACSRLTGLEMTHLGLHLKELQEAGLIARLWGIDAKKGRTWGRPWVQWADSTEGRDNSDDGCADINNGNTRFTFCTLPHPDEEEEDCTDRKELLSDSGGPRRYQDYGQLSRSGWGDTRRFPFATEADRLKRYYYFPTDKGLLALLWLEGFPLTFEPRFRGELTRLARIRSEVEVGERRLVLTYGLYDSPARSGSLFLDGGVQNLAKIDGQPHSEDYDAIGFSWPSLLVEHFSGASNFFLAFPSHHFSYPFQTAPAIYPLPQKHGIKQEQERVFNEKAASFFKNIGRRHFLFGTASEISLESWQTEPVCHRYYILPQRLAKLGYDIPYTYTPDLSVLKLEAGGARGECLPDGYAEVIIERDGRKPERAVIYLEFERGQRNWVERYKGKIATYLGLFWSEWLFRSMKERRPALYSPNNVPVYVLVVTSDARQEQKLRQLFKVAVQNELADRLRQAHYLGYGPGGVSAGEIVGGLDSEEARSIVNALLDGLGVQFLTTNEGLLSWRGVLAPIWQRI